MPGVAVVGVWLMASPCCPSAAASLAWRVQAHHQRGDRHGHTHDASEFEGTKLYAVRDKKGRFKDISDHKKAHGQDIKRKAKDEK